MLHRSRRPTSTACESDIDYFGPLGSSKGRNTHGGVTRNIHGAQMRVALSQKHSLQVSLQREVREKGSALAYTLPGGVVYQESKHREGAHTVREGTRETDTVSVERSDMVSV